MTLDEVSTQILLNVICDIHCYMYIPEIYLYGISPCKKFCKLYDICYTRREEIPFSYVREKAKELYITLYGEESLEAKIFENLL